MNDQESFISHLIELRQRLMRAVGAVLVEGGGTGEGRAGDDPALPVAQEGEDEGEEAERDDEGAHDP